MKTLIGLLAGLSLLVCTSAAFLYFWGHVSMAGYKSILFLSSICYFIFATLWATRKSASR